MKENRRYRRKVVSRLEDSAEEIFAEKRIQFAYLYGSFATGTAHSFSDLDIGIFLSNTSVRESLRIELATALTVDEVFGHAVDAEVRAINRLPLIVAGKVVTEGVLVFCRDDGARISYESAVRMAYFDFLPFILRQQKSYCEQLASS